jgi:hypothetical protein
MVVSFLNASDVTVLVALELLVSECESNTGATALTEMAAIGVAN